MSRATLVINADTSAIRRSLGEIPGITRRAQAAMTTEARREEAKRERLAEKEARATKQAADKAARDSARAEKEKTKAAERESKARERAAQSLASKLHAEAKRVTRDLANEEKARTRDAEREARQRTQAAEREARERRRLSREASREARQMERGIRREVRQTLRDHRSTVNRRAEVAGAVVGAVGNYAGTMHAQIQDARAARAAVQSNVIGAVSQVGVANTDEVNRYTEMALAANERHGLSAEVITRAIAAAQTEFSTLGGMQEHTGDGTAARAAREAIYQRAIDTAVRGRNMGVDPGEYSRLMGMLNNRGLDENTQSFLSAWTVGAQDRGAVEAGSVTREALSPIMQRMSAAIAALPAGASAEDRSQAQRNAYMQAFAELQVLRSLGESARLAGNAMANFERALSNTGTVSKIRTNIQHIGDRQLRARVMGAVTDGHGHLREGMNNPLRFVAAAMGAGVTDPRMMANIFAGTGQGNPQAFQANVRRMMSGLSAQDNNGVTGVQRVNALTESSVALSPEALAGRAGLYERSDEANLSRNLAAQMIALTGNTSAVDRLSNAIADWSARHPFAATAAVGVASTTATLFGQQALRWTMGGGLSTAARAAAGAVPRVAMGLGRAALGPVGALAGLLTLGGTWGGMDSENTAYQHGLAQNPEEWMRQDRRLTAERAAAHQPPPTAAEIGAAVAAALRANPATVSLDPHTAAQAASQNASQRPGRQ